MSAYRFCRSDDVALLVRAYNECYRVHFPHLPEMTEDRFKRRIRELDVWTSSCMVASEGDEQIGVLIAGKRDTESLIDCVGIRADHRRKEHGRHLLTSLSHKLAILGPPRLRAEVPEGQVAGRALLEACGYEQEGAVTDYVLERRPLPPRPSELVIPVSVDELVAGDAWDTEGLRAWERSPRTLLGRKERIQGLGIASGERIEAHVLWIDDDDRQRVVDVGCADEERAAPLLGRLIQQACATHERPVLIEGIGDDELPAELLRSWGFEPGERRLLYAAEAVPG